MHQHRPENHRGRGSSLRRVQQRRVQHAMLGLARLHALHRHAERIQAHVGRGLAGFARRRPLRLRLRRLDHPPLFLLRPQALAVPFRATQHRRGRHPHARKTLEHILGRIGKRHQRPRQTHQRHQPRTDLVHQPQHVVIGKETLLAPAAVVVGPPNLHFAMHRQHPPLLIRVKLGRILAVRTGHAAPYVPLFFRLATLACRTSLANFCPASRNSKSMAPNSSASGTSTARSTIWRTVCVDLRPKLLHDGFDALFPGPARSENDVVRYGLIPPV